MNGQFSEERDGQDFLWTLNGENNQRDHFIS